MIDGLFDESPDVREEMGQVVARLFGLQHPICPLRGVSLIFFGLSDFLQRPIEWLIQFYQSLLTSVVDRAVTLIRCREM